MQSHEGNRLNYRKKMMNIVCPRGKVEQSSFQDRFQASTETALSFVVLYYILYSFDLYLVQADAKMRSAQKRGKDRNKVIISHLKLYIILYLFNSDYLFNVCIIKYGCISQVPCI